MPSLFSFLRENARWLAAGFLMALASSFGQTFFIAIFSEPLRQSFSLSEGEFASIYMVATLGSAFTLIWLGQLADTVPPRRLAALIALALAGVCLAMASVTHWLVLIPVIFGLRLFGQGMISHLSQTTMARWFVATRGRALAVASFGYPTGEALAPLAAVALIAAVGWRQTWVIAALFVLLVLLPALSWLLAKDRAPRGFVRAGDLPEGESSGLGGRHWTRREVLAQPLFWCLVPGILTPGFVLTTVFFFPAHIAETKGWAFAELPSRYWIYAVSSVVASMIYGLAIDRFGARACLAVYQLPMAAGLFALWAGEEVATVSWLMALIGLSAGAAATVHSALWAEMYGTRHIGAIKAFAHALMVVSTALGPGLVGAAIDAGYPFAMQGLWMASYVVAISLVFAGLGMSGALWSTAEASDP